MRKHQAATALRHLVRRDNAALGCCAAARHDAPRSQRAACRCSTCPMQRNSKSLLTDALTYTCIAKQAANNSTNIGYEMFAPEGVKVPANNWGPGGCHPDR